MWIYDQIKEKLFKEEIDTANINAYFQRLDVEEFFNQLNNLYHPDELLRKLGGHQNLPLLHKDSEIYAAVDKRLAALYDTKLVIEGDSADAVKFFEEQILPHERQLKGDFFWAGPYGYQVEQIIYDPDRSCKVIGFQAEEFWRFNPMPDLRHVVLQETSNSLWRGKVMPYGKFVLTTNNGTAFNPRGDAYFERLIQPWIFRCNGWDLWMDFAKRFANGFMHGKISDEKKVKEFRLALEKAGKSSVVVTDKNTELTMIQASRDSSIYDMLDSKTVATMQKVVLGEVLTSQVQQGSFAAASIHNEVRFEKTRSDITLVEKSLNETMKQIALVCGMDLKSVPKARLMWETGPNQELAVRDNVLYNTGVKFTKEYFINKYGLEEDEFEIKEEAAPAWGFSSQNGKRSFLSKKDVAEFLAKPAEHKCKVHTLAPNVTRKSNKQTDQKEDVVAYLNRNGEQPINMDDLVSAIRLSKNDKELQENLAKLFDSRNNLFVDTLTEAFYAASVDGALMGNPERIESDD